jgi:hypothetical protein
MDELGERVPEGQRLLSLRGDAEELVDAGKRLVGRPAASASPDRVRAFDETRQQEDRQKRLVPEPPHEDPRRAHAIPLRVAALLSAHSFTPSGVTDASCTTYTWGEEHDNANSGPWSASGPHETGWLASR